jgi:hypothetical protein
MEQGIQSVPVQLIVLQHSTFRSLLYTFVSSNRIAELPVLAL